MQSSDIDDVENALSEAFNDIFVCTELTNDTNESICSEDDDTSQTSKVDTLIEKPSVKNTSPSILPISIPCSIGSLPTPCAPVFDDLWNIPVSKTPFESLIPFNDEQLAEYYENKLLFGLQEHTEEFNQSELKNFQACEHPLNTLLQNYLHARLKLGSIKQEIKESKYSYITHEKHIWTLEPASYTQYGECQVNKFDFFYLCVIICVCVHINIHSNTVVCNSICIYY